MASRSFVQWWVNVICRELAGAGKNNQVNASGGQKRAPERGAFQGRTLVCSNGVPDQTVAVRASEPVSELRGSPARAHHAELAEPVTVGAIGAEPTG